MKNKIKTRHCQGEKPALAGLSPVAISFCLTGLMIFSYGSSLLTEITSATFGVLVMTCFFIWMFIGQLEEGCRYHFLPSTTIYLKWKLFFN